MKTFWKKAVDSVLWIKYTWEMGEKKFFLLFLLQTFGMFLSTSLLLQHFLHGIVALAMAVLVTFLLVWAATFLFLTNKNKYVGWIADVLAGMFFGSLMYFTQYLMIYTSYLIVIEREGHVTAEQIVVLTFILPMVVIILLGKIVYDIYKYRKEKNTSKKGDGNDAK